MTKKQKFWLFALLIFTNVYVISTRGEVLRARDDIATKCSVYKSLAE